MPAITYRVDSVSEVQTEKRLAVDSLTEIVMNLESDTMEYYD